MMLWKAKAFYDAVPKGPKLSHLSHEMLHDAVESKDMAAGCDLWAQWIGVQGYGALHLATCHHDHLHIACVVVYLSHFMA